MTVPGQQIILPTGFQRVLFTDGEEYKLMKKRHFLEGGAAKPDLTFSGCRRCNNGEIKVNTVVVPMKPDYDELGVQRRQFLWPFMKIPTLQERVL